MKAKVRYNRRRTTKKASRASAPPRVSVGQALRAARQAGAEAVEVRRDGTLVVLMKATTSAPADEYEVWEREYEQAKAARRRVGD